MNKNYEKGFEQGCWTSFLWSRIHPNVGMSMAFRRFVIDKSPQSIDELKELENAHMNLLDARGE